MDPFWPIFELRVSHSMKPCFIWYMNGLKRHYLCFNLNICCLVAQSCSTLCNPMICSPPGSSVHGIFQGRILKWITIPFSRGFSRPRDRTQVSRLGGRRFNLWATREAHFLYRIQQWRMFILPNPSWIVPHGFYYFYHVLLSFHKQTHTKGFCAWFRFSFFIFLDVFTLYLGNITNYEQNPSN